MVSDGRRMIRRAVSVVAVGFCLVASGCLKPKPVSADVIVLHTGRIRGNVYPLSLQSISPLQHYQYVAGYVKSVRAEAAKTGAKVILVDLGDSLTGSFASHATQSANMVTFFNDVGYDAVVMSNLDDAVTPGVLAGLKARVLNPFQDSEGQPATAGTTFATRFEIGGLPVCLLANFYGDTGVASHPERFPAAFGATQSAVAPVRSYGQVIEALGPRPPGTLSLLSWMKFESPKVAPEAFLASMRELRIDAILAHRIYGASERDVWAESAFLPWKPPVSLNILRNNGGFTVARLDLKRDGGGWKVLGHSLLPMTANTAPADSLVSASIEKFAPVISAADARLASLPGEMGNAEILRLYMSSLTDVPGTDVVLYSAQSIRNDWPSGELRASAVFGALPWTTPVVQLTLSREQINEVADKLGLARLEKSTAFGGQLTVTTSQFFARIIAARLALPADAIRATERASEFDAFVACLKSHPPEVLPSEDWEFHGGK